MASTENYFNSNNKPCSKSNPNPNPEIKVEAAAPPAAKIKFQGARRKSDKYAAELRHGNKRIWLGTFCTADEAALAYDLAALRLRNKTYNFPVGANSRIISTIDPAKQDAIEKKVDKKLGRSTRPGANNTSERPETSKKRKRARKSDKKEFEQEEKARKKREAEYKQRAEELVGFL